MSRMYIVNHWSDAAAYSGEQIGDRLKDSQALHFNRDGSANVNLYSEEIAVAKKASKVSIKNQILPQAARVERLTQQMHDLVSAYKAGEMDCKEYTQLLDILTCKRDRAEVLLKKALAQKPVREDDAHPVKASPKTTTQPSPAAPTSPIKKNLTSLWTETKVFLVGSVAACAGLLWMAN